MKNVVLFIPNSIKTHKRGFLIGDFCAVSEFTHVFYVLEIADSIKNGKDPPLGCFNVGDNLPRKVWINLTSSDDLLEVNSLKINNKTVNLGLSFCTWILYEPDIFVRSSPLECDQFERQDLLKNLCSKVRTSMKKDERTLKKGLWLSVVAKVALVVSLLAKGLQPLHPILKYSMLGEHVQSSIQGVLGVLVTCQKEERLTLQLRSHVLRITVDMVVGGFLLAALLHTISWESFPDMFLTVAESVVTSLRDLLHWLAGDPAGFKLNYAFNKMLATFFLFHIDIWWIFLVFLKPVFQVIFILFIIVGQLGLTFQAAILADLLALVSFHVYCIYAYAARLYNIQVAGLVSLCRLFLGRKMNPLRGKVDSCSYTPDQLFVGTLGFTVLLFLLPTTLMYYLVFTTMRLLVVAFGGLLTRVRHIMHSLPLYTTLMWLLARPEVCNNAHLTLDSATPTSSVFHVTLVPDTLCQTIARFEPVPLSPPLPLRASFQQILSNLCRGKLVYPV